MKLLIKIIFLYILYSCDNYCGCCCNCFRWNKDDEIIKNNEYEEEVDKIINGQYKDITDEELKQVVKEILLIEKYGSCIVCKDTYNSCKIRDNYDFESNTYTYSYSKEKDIYVRDDGKPPFIFDNKFNYRHSHICMSMLAKSNKSEDNNKILGDLYRKGVVGYILKHESDSYLIGDGFINFQRRDGSSNIYYFESRFEDDLCIQYKKIDENISKEYFIEMAKKDMENNKMIKNLIEGGYLNKNKIKSYVLCDFLLNCINIEKKIKASERSYLKFTSILSNILESECFMNCVCFNFTNLSLLLAKDDEKCYRLKDDITQDDNFPFVDVNLEDTLSTEIKIVGEEKNKYYDNIFFYKPTKNFFKNACNTGCLNNNNIERSKIIDSDSIPNSKINHLSSIEYNEIPIVPIKKVNNNNSDEIKYTLECIDLFVDMRTQNKKDEDERRVEHYNKALNLLEKKKKKYVIVLTDEYFVIDTVKNLLEYFKDKDEDDIFSDLDYGKNYKINYDIDFNKRYKTEN